MCSNTYSLPSYLLEADEDEEDEEIKNVFASACARVAVSVDNDEVKEEQIRETEETISTTELDVFQVRHETIPTVPDWDMSANATKVKTLTKSILEVSDLCELLPNKRVEPSEVIPDVFTPLTEQQMQKLQEEMETEQQTEMENNEEVETDERAESPGKKYDHILFEFENDPVLRKPRFQARAYALAFQGALDQKDHSKLISHASKLEKQIKRDYLNEYRANEKIRKQIKKLSFQSVKRKTTDKGKTHSVQS